MGITDAQRVSLLLQELNGMLTSFRERCAQEADREVATCKHLGHDDYYPRMAAVHIREIDVYEWLKKYHGPEIAHMVKVPRPAGPWITAVPNPEDT